MKKDCAYTRKSLRKYLRGHLFKYEQVRIARHLNACPVCRSEFQALKKVVDTKQLLKDITPPDSVVERLKAGASGLAKLKLLIYRPLWGVAIIGVCALIYVNVASRHRDVEIENIEKSLAAAVASAPTVTHAAAAGEVPPVTAQLTNRAAESKPAAQPQTPAPAGEPLLITIAPKNEKSSIQRINEVMGNAQLGKKKFSDTVREISGDLPARELSTFLNRIERAGKVSYNRKRLESFSTAQSIPFVMVMKPAPKTQRPSLTPQAEYKSGEAAAAAAALPESAPTQTVP